MTELILLGVIIGLQIVTIVNTRQGRREIETLRGEVAAEARNVEDCVSSVAASQNEYAGRLHDRMLAALPKRRTRKAAQ